MKTTVEVTQHETKFCIDLVGDDYEWEIVAVRVPSATFAHNDSADISKWIDTIAPDIWSDLTDLAIAALIKDRRDARQEYFCDLVKEAV